MKKMQKILSKRVVVSIIAIFAILLASPVSAWGPERPTYTNQSPADYATFNSITDNAAVGDERNFVRIGEAGSTDPYEDTIEVVPGKEYEVYIYYHNNAASNTNSTGFGMATDARISSAYPTLVSPDERGMISGIISWNYIEPSDVNTVKNGKVWDEAYVTSTEDVVLRYKTGSATIHNAGRANNTVLSTNLFTETGILIGYNNLDGTLPGCAEYSGYITYTLVAEKTQASLTKQVSLDGENWSDSVSAKPGDYVTYKVQFKNTGNTNLTNVILQDTHDTGLTIRPGSTKVFDLDNPDGKVIDDIIGISGYNTGDLLPGGMVQLIYQAQIDWDNNDICKKGLKNTITAKFNSTEELKDDTTVTVECGPVKDCVTNPEMEECQELPNTGPLEIVMAALIIAGIIAGGYYLYRSRKTLNKVTNKVQGGSDTDDNSTILESDKKEDKNKKSSEK